MTFHPDIPEEFRNQIITGDARELTKRLPDESIDLIFTDPPYLRAYLSLYEWLANEAMRLLTSSGFLLVYTGCYHKDTIMDFMRRSNLKFFWDLCAVNYQGPGPMIWQRKIISKYKSILVYHRPDCRPLPRTNVLSVFNGTDKDKQFHVWQQDLATARYYIDCFRPGPGSIVFDPFAGGGTTLYACKVLGLDFVSFEIDPTTADIARARTANIQHLLFEMPHFQVEMPGLE